MKKLALLVFVCTLLLLSGCSCEHEWVGGTCEEPYICAKCDTAGPAAPGHVWSEATCTMPQICAACGKTQGTILEHAYAEWILSDNFYIGEPMHRICERCGNTEQGEVDWDFYLQNALCGYWGQKTAYISAPFVSTKTYPSNYALAYSSVGQLKIHDYAIFNEDHTGTYFDGETLQDFSWTPLSVETTDAFSERMAIGLTFADGSTQTWNLDGYGALYLDGDESSLSHDPMGWIVGSLEFTNTDPRQTMEFFPDHTFSWNHPEGEITGNWYPHTDYVSSYYNEQDVTHMHLRIIVLEYSFNGQEQVSYLEHYMEDSSLDQLLVQNEIFLEKLDFSFYLTERAEPVIMNKVS